MVWKFNTTVAQEKHESRTAPREPSFSADDVVALDLRVEPEFNIEAPAQALLLQKTGNALLDEGADAPIHDFGFDLDVDTPAATPTGVVKPKLYQPAVAPPGFRADAAEFNIPLYLGDLTGSAASFVSSTTSPSNIDDASELDIPLNLGGETLPSPEPVSQMTSQADLTTETDEGIPVLTVRVEDVPSGDLNWDIPAFQGTVDELPDLRPIPPAPEDHPGLQHRGANSFGHALRFPHDDPRQAVWAEQRRARGFDDTELWGLDDAFARFILPRLKALRQQKLTPPARMETVVWYGLLDKMIRAFELLLPEGGGAWDRGALSDKERSQVHEGLDHFRMYYFSLCW